MAAELTLALLVLSCKGTTEPWIAVHRGPILEAEYSMGILADEGTGAVLHANIVGGVCDAVGLAAVTVNGFLNQERCFARHDWLYEHWTMGFARSNYSDDLLRRAKPRLHGGEGDPAAQAGLGIAFADGLGVEKCMLCAKQWFETVIDPDETRTGAKNASDETYKFWVGVSAVRMAQLYVDNALSMERGYQSLNDRRDNTRWLIASPYFEVGVQMGLPSAQFYLAELLRTNRIGHTGAQYSAGMRAVRLYVRSANMGFPMAQTRLGYMAFYGVDDVVEDKSFALLMWRAAALDGEIVATLNLALVYLRDAMEIVRLGEKKGGAARWSSATTDPGTAAELLRSAKALLTRGAVREYSASMYALGWVLQWEHTAGLIPGAAKRSAAEEVYVWPRTKKRSTKVSLFYVPLHFTRILLTVLTRSP